jgi:hypothetical protein
MNRTGLQVVMTGDNRSVMRAMKELSVQSERTGRQVSRDSGTASTSFRKVGDAAEASRKRISGMAGMIGLGGLAFGLKDVVQAGIKWQTQQGQLQVALKNTGNNAALASRKITDAAEKLSTHGGFGAAQTLQGMTQFVRVSGSATDAIKKTTLATNIARGTGRDFTQILRALMMAEQGRTTGLARLGVAIPKVTTAEDALKQARYNSKISLEQLTAAGYKFTSAQKAQYQLHQQITPAMLAQAKAQDLLASKNQVFQVLQQRYGGSTTSYSNKTAGQISNAQNALDIAFKTMSKNLLPVIAKIATSGAAVVMYLISHKSILITLGIAIGSVTAILTANKIVMEVMRAKTIAVSFAQGLLAITTRGAATGTAELGASATAAGGQLTLFETETAAAGGKMGLLKTGLTGFGGKISGLLGPLSKLAMAAGVAALIFEGLKSGSKLNDALTRHQHGRSIVQGALQGAGAGALAGGTFGLLGGPFSPVTVAAGAALGGVAGGIAGAGSGLITSFLAPRHHSGGVVQKPRYFAGGGPVGGDTVPGWLTPGEGIVTTQGMNMIGPGGLSMLNGGGGMGGPMRITPGTTIVKLDARIIARAVTEYMLQKGARGPSSLVGGSLSTGAAVTGVVPG